MCNETVFNLYVQGIAAGLFDGNQDQRPVKKIRKQGPLDELRQKFPKLVLKKYSMKDLHKSYNI